MSRVGPEVRSAPHAGLRHRAVGWRYRTALRTARALDAIAAATEPRKADRGRSVGGPRAGRA